MFEQPLSSRGDLSTLRRLGLRTMSNPEEGKPLTGEQSPEKPTGPQVESLPPRSSLRELVNEVSEMASNLERAWSEALDGTPSLSSAQEQVRGQLQSLTQVLVHEVEAESAALRAAGFDPTLTFSNPMSDDQLRETVTFNGPVGEFRRIAIARQLALQDFLTVTGAMFKKPNRTFREGEGMKEWWSSGAFDLIIARADLLLQLHEDAQALTQRIIGAKGNPTERRLRSMLDHLASARRLLVSGQPLAALGHQLAALRLRILGSGDPTDEAIAAPVSQLAAKCPSLAPLSEALRVAERTVAEAGRGEGSSLATATVLAYQLHDRVVHAVMAPEVDEFKAAISHPPA